MLIASLFNGHDAGACLTNNGEVLVHIQKERITRVKEAGGSAEECLQLCLDETGIDFSEVDVVASSVFIHPTDSTYEIPLYTKRFGLFDTYRPIGAEYRGVNGTYFGTNKVWSKHNIRLFGQIKPAYMVHHHISHAAVAFYTSPFDEALIWTPDGGGDDASAVLAVGRGNQIEVFDWNREYALGGAWTGYCENNYGWSHRRNFDEDVSWSEGRTGNLQNYSGHYAGSLMALASYGKPDYLDEVLADIQSGKARQGFRDGLNLEDKQSDLSKNVASSLQKATEHLFLEAVTRLYNKYQIKQLCLAGGCAYNCLSNTVVLQETQMKEVYVPPIPEDAGLCVGQALYTYYHILNHPRLKETSSYSPYKGRGFSSKQIETCLQDNSDQLQWRPSTLDEVADLLQDGKVIGFFHGRSETGKRALGNRSVLADPRRHELKEQMNEIVKHREWFRPFAPTILDEYCDEYFTPRVQSPYMSFLATVKEDKRNDVPAVLHVDNTARPQTLKRDSNPTYYDLIDKFRQRTGVPMLLNTSFNDREPIVDSPTDAIRCFLNTNMDYIYFQGTLAWKRQSSE